MANNLYNVGDQVVKSSTRELSFRGKVLEVIPPEKIPAILAAMHKLDPAYAEQTINVWSTEDRGFQDFHCYFVEPDTCPGPASYEESLNICPSLTKANYDMIVGNVARKYLVIESNLLPAENDPAHK